MRIAMLSDVETSGGAAIAASRLAATFCREGNDVTRIVGWPQEGSHPWRTEVLRVRNGLWPRIARRALPERFFERTVSRHLENRLDALLTRLKPDFINVHNLHSCFRQGWRTGLVRICNRHAPTIWTLHDMWSFTGRCAYSYDCEKFVSGCDELCPTPEEYPALMPQKIRRSWQQRSRFFRTEPDLIAVTPSEWLARVAKRGLWRDHRIEVIPYGLPLNLFKPLDRQAARESLGVADTAPVLLFVCHNLSDRRKGTNLFFEALEVLNSPITLLSMGSSAPTIQNPHVKHISLGYVEDNAKKVAAYNAADLCVHAALAENLPNVVLESIACGTPVIAFAVGGVAEIVRPRVTGWLVQEVSPGSLRLAIQSALGESPHLRESCRQIAEEEFSDALQARRYLTLLAGSRQRKSV